MAKTHDLIAYMIDNEIEFNNLSGSVILFEIDFNLTNKQLRGIIIYAMKIGFKLTFDHAKIYIDETI